MSIAEARALAKRRMPRVVFDFVDGGAEDEVTMTNNRRAFEACELVPRFLEARVPPSTSVSVAGTALSFPLAIGPTGFAGITGPGADVAGMRAAAASDTAFTLATLANSSIETVREGASGELWMQLYLWEDREACGGLIKRALACDVSVLMVTIDCPELGSRERDRRNGFAFPPRASARGICDLATHPRWLASMRRGVDFPNLRPPGVVRQQGLRNTLREAQAADESLRDCRVSMDDLHWVREQWPGKLLVKGVLSPRDARLAVHAGADGVVVSNHGGRQLDSAVSSLRALSPVVAEVGAEVDVLIDGGVRRGSDIVKALCMGAKAVLIGRAYAYGLGAGGQAGVTRALDILRADVIRTMKLLGVAAIKDLDGSFVDVPPEWTARLPR
jgi:isopentenyl diphosphate isomerase/L-lactate dehydrogenase-like FMN-dependent dehydrogenase